VRSSLEWKWLPPVEGEPAQLRAERAQKLKVGVSAPAPTTQEPNSSLGQHLWAVEPPVHVDPPPFIPLPHK